jgi:hypothetical protein
MGGKTDFAGHVVQGWVACGFATTTEADPARTWAALRAAARQG